MSTATKKLPSPAKRLFAIDAFVATNRTWIMSEENPSLTAIRRRAEVSLGHKCSTTTIRDCMERQKIPIRRSAAEAELIQLKEQNERLRQVILRIAAYTNLPAAIASELRDSYDLNVEIVDALRLNRKGTV